MYVPPKFKPQSAQEVKEFIKKYSFATLISYHENRPIATHIPLLMATKAEGQQVLLGHISKGNPQWKTIVGQEVLVIFAEPHSYISSAWYDHVNVPTWNYIAVHVYGKVTILDEKALYDSLKDLVDTYEAGHKKRFHIEDLPEKMLKREMRGVVGFEISMDTIEAAYKLSQNRDENNKQLIIEKLEERNDAFDKDIAEEMGK